MSYGKSLFKYYGWLLKHFGWKLWTENEILKFQNFEISIWNYQSLVFKLFFELLATMKCLFLTLQDFLKEKDSKVKSERKLWQKLLLQVCNKKFV